MKVHVEHRWQMNALAIWVTEHYPAGMPSVMQVVGADGEGDFTVKNVEYDPTVQNPDIKPTLVLPMPMIEALVAALGDYLPPSAAQGEHLKDAIKVRDRLLALVEAS